MKLIRVLSALGVFICFVLWVSSALASRNSSGTMAGINGPYTAGSVISSSVINARLADIETEITDSLDRSGKGPMLAPLRLTNGTNTAPSLTFDSETTAGLYRVSSGIIAMTYNSTESCRWTSLGIRCANGAVATPSLSFFNDTGSGLYRIGASDIGFAINGTLRTEWSATGFGVGASPGTLLDAEGTHVANKGLIYAKGVGGHGYIIADTDSPTTKEAGFTIDNNGTALWSIYKPANVSDLRINNGTDRVTVTSSGVTLANDLTVSGNATVTGNMTALKVGSGGTSSTQLNFGSCTLNGASPSQCTATVVAGAKCVASTVGSVVDTAAASVSVSATTLTVTKENGSTKVVNYVCF